MRASVRGIRPASRRGSSVRKSRRRPTLPLGRPSSTIGSKELNFRVRDGIGCGLLDITTGNLWVRPIGSSAVRASRDALTPWLQLRHAASCTRTPGASFDVCLRSMVKPHDLLVPVSSADCSRFHTRPINLVVYEGSLGPCGRDT